MDFAYYIVREKDMVIIDGAEDMVTAIKMAQQGGFAALILQGCVITKVGEDAEEVKDDLSNEPSATVEAEIVD